MKPIPMTPDGQDARPTSPISALRLPAIPRVQERWICRGTAGGRWREVGFMNFPVKENALGMSTRQIGWEKRKRVKEATTTAAATATSSFSLLLDSTWILPSYFFTFSPVVLYSLHAPTFQLLRTFELFTKAFLGYVYREIQNRELVLYLASCFPII